MSEYYTATQFQKVMLPITPDCDCQSLLRAAHLIAEPDATRLVGLAGVPSGESLSTGALIARRVRQSLHQAADEAGLSTLIQVRVSHDPWEEFLDLVAEENPDLIILGWPEQFEELQITLQEVLIRPPCDIALVHGPILDPTRKLLVPLRGSPYAEYALRVALAMADHASADLTSLHFTPPGEGTRPEPTFLGLTQVIQNLPEIHHIERPAADPSTAILEEARNYDLVVMGATSKPDHRTSPLGSTTEQVLKSCDCGVIVVKPQHFPSLEPVAGDSAISILVDKWFAEKTFHAEEFSDLDYLVDLKESQGLSISLALPALNEEETVGRVIEIIKSNLYTDTPLLDEIVLMDSNSTDRTRSIARELEIPVYIHQEVLPEYGPRPGKGEALWKSLYVTRGDIIIWVDTDIVNFHPRFVYGLLGPLLANPDLQFVKGFYRRPLRVGEKTQAGGGGRVTELTARPLLNLFFPELSGIVQPLSGEYGGRRSALEQLPFYSGYGVETGLLIDVFESFGLNAIAQVDLKERIHHNQPLESLSKMSFAIIQVVMNKLEKRFQQDLLTDVNRSMKLIRYQPGRLFLEVEQIAERIRPPMIQLSEYQERLSP